MFAHPAQGRSSFRRLRPVQWWDLRRKQWESRAGALGYPTLGNVSRTNSVTPGDGGQPLYVDTEQICEGRRLGLTQLRELRSYMRHRAVVLAQLRTGADVLSRRCI